MGGSSEDTPDAIPSGGADADLLSGGVVLGLTGSVLNKRGEAVHFDQVQEGTQKEGSKNSKQSPGPKRGGGRKNWKAKREGKDAFRRGKENYGVGTLCLCVNRVAMGGN